MVEATINYVYDKMPEEIDAGHGQILIKLDYSKYPVQEGDIHINVRQVALDTDGETRTKSLNSAYYRLK